MTFEPAGVGKDTDRPRQGPWIRPTGVGSPSMNIDPKAAIISLLNAPECVSGVPEELILDLLAQLRALEARLLARLVTPRISSAQEGRAEPERLLAAAETAARRGV